MLCLVGVCMAYSIQNKPQVGDAVWLAWSRVHKKVYKNAEEERMRYAIWKDNIDYIDEFNANNKHMILDINRFGDMTHHEFRYRIKPKLY